jgi:DNA (cytosine-5)-methyltransferase 1
LGAVELDRLAAATYRMNHPKTYLWNTDIRKLDACTVLDGIGLRPGELDLLAGCPPCQGFSHLRTLNRSRRVDDARNDLVHDYLRFVEVIRPRAVLLENVPALADDMRMELLVSRLERLGYPACQGFRILNAADYGVPQRRQRLVLMVGLGGPLLVESTTHQPVTVRQTIAHLLPPGRTGDFLHDLPERRTPRIQQLISRIPHDGGSRLDLGCDEQLECHKRTKGFYDIYGRMAWDKPAPTITTGCHNPSRGRFLHPEQDRAITLREAALLQSFPASYKFSQSAGKEAIAAMIGNAIPPGFVAEHAKQAKRALSNL